MMGRRAAILLAAGAVALGSVAVVGSASADPVGVECSSDGATLTCPLPAPGTVTETATETETVTGPGQTVTVTNPGTTVRTTVRTTVKSTVTKTVTGTPTAAPTTPSTVPTTPTTSSTTATTPTTTSAAPTTVTTQPSTGGIVALGRSFPDSSTTGVPAGTVLTPYTGSCSITTANVTIDRKTITCDQFRLLAPGIVITNSIVNGTVYSDCCYLNGAFSITDSEIRGPNSTGTVVGEARFSLTRVEVTGGSRGVYCNDTCTVTDSYVHGQYTDLRGIDHESGIRADANATLRHNTITCDAKPIPPDSGCSAAISMYGDFGISHDNTITDNLIDGGPDGSMGYCVYGGSVPGKPYPHANHIVYQNNVFLRGPSNKCGIWGPVSDFTSSEPGNVWSGNRWAPDGATVPADH